MTIAGVSGTFSARPPMGSTCADRDLVPDLAEFRRCVSASFDELLAFSREGTTFGMDGRVACIVDARR